MKITLDRTFVLNGAFFGPGEVDVDDDTGKALKARMAELQAQEQPAEEADDEPKRARGK